MAAMIAGIIFLGVYPQPILNALRYSVARNSLQRRALVPSAYPRNRRLGNASTL